MFELNKIFNFKDNAIRYIDSSRADMCEKYSSDEGYLVPSYLH